MYTPRKILEDRRTAAAEIVTLKKQIEDCGDIGEPRGIVSGRRPEKVPGKDEYVVVDSATNHPQAMRGQQEDGYRQKLEALVRDKAWLFIAAEDIIETLDDGTARIILRNYFCLNQTDDQIALLLDRDRRSICDQRNKAVQWIERNYQKIFPIHATTRHNTP